MNKNAIRPEKCVPSLPQDFHNPFRNLEKNLMDPTPGFVNRVQLQSDSGKVMSTTKNLFLLEIKKKKHFLILFDWKWPRKFRTLIQSKVVAFHKVNQIFPFS